MSMPYTPRIWPPNPGPITPIQPFTYEDGITYVEILYALKNYIEKELVPQLNNFPDEINDAIAQLIADVTAELARQMEIVDGKLEEQDTEVDEKLVTLTAYVDNAVASIVGSSIAVQDPVVAGIFSNASSATRGVTNTIYAPISLTATVTALGAALTTLTGRVTATENKNTDQDTAIGGLGTRTTAIENTLDGRLSTATLDGRYVLKEIAPVAVFFGSSNVVTGTWPEQFCTMMGYAVKNYAIGGGSFTGSSTTNYATQISNAAADTSLNKNTVKYVFLADIGNDARSQTTNALFRTAANSVLNSLRSTFPNARIILVPSLWGITAGNVNNQNLVQGAIRALTEFEQSLRDYSLTYNMEVVENTHLWHYDSPNWMLPNEVHYTAAGYQRIAQMMRDYMRTGESPVMKVGKTSVTSMSGVDASGVLAGRDGNMIEVIGQFNVTTAIAIDGNLFQLPEGVFPMVGESRCPIVSPTRAPDKAINIFGTANNGTSRGLVRAFSALSTGVHYVNLTLPAF